MVAERGQVLMLVVLTFFRIAHGGKTLRVDFEVFHVINLNMYVCIYTNTV